MLVEVMLICALTNVAPYYDCDAPKWAIIAYDEPFLNDVPVPKLCNKDVEYKIFGCASYNINKEMDAYFTPIIILSSTNYIDVWGMNTLQHEIQHIKCRCVWEGHD